MTINHTKECEQQFVERTAAREAWARLWPNYCKTCNGAGAHYSTYDPSPAGVSLSSGYMTDVDTCQDCSDKGICARCGKQVWNPETDDCSSSCPHCGWDGQDCMPSEPECYCYFLEIPDVMLEQE